MIHTHIVLFYLHLDARKRQIMAQYHRCIKRFIQLHICIKMMYSANKVFKYASLKNIFFEIDIEEISTNKLSINLNILRTFFIRKISFLM